MFAKLKQNYLTYFSLSYLLISAFVFLIYKTYFPINNLSFFGNIQFLNGDSAQTKILYFFASFVCLTLILPILEEFIFRYRLKKCSKIFGRISQTFFYVLVFGLASSSSYLNIIDLDETKAKLFVPLFILLFVTIRHIFKKIDTTFNSTIFSFIIGVILSTFLSNDIALSPIFNSLSNLNIIIISTIFSFITIKYNWKFAILCHSLYNFVFYLIIPKEDFLISTVIYIFYLLFIITFGFVLKMELEKINKHTII